MTSVTAFLTRINTDSLVVWLRACIDFLTEKGVPFQRPLNQDRWWPSLPQGPLLPVLPHRSHHLGPTDTATCIQIKLTFPRPFQFSLFFQFSDIETMHVCFFFPFTHPHSLDRLNISDRLDWPAESIACYAIKTNHFCR